MQEELDSENSNNKNKKKKLKIVDEKTNDCLYPRKTKVMIDFNDQESASIKSFAVKKK